MSGSCVNMRSPIPLQASPARLGTPQDPQDVILRVREAHGLQEVSASCTSESATRNNSRNTCCSSVMLASGLRTGCGFDCHDGDYTRYDNYCQEEFYGFCVGRISTSLIKLCGACVTRAATAWATSSGWSIFLRSLPACGPKSVSTEPGQTTLTRMLNARRSSARQKLNPCNPHFEAQYTAPPGERILSCKRTDIDDVPSAVLHHSGDNCFADQEHRLQVGV